MCAVFGSACHREAADPGPAVDTGDPRTASEQIAEADKLYGMREDLTKVRQAVALLRQARLSDYGNFDAAWKLARSDYFLGDHTTVEAERDNAFREGEEAGKSAVKLQPDKPEGHFWLGANYGGSAKHSTLAGLSSVEDIRSSMEAVLKIDEGFQSGSAYLGLGQLYLEAPKIFGGDSQKAVGYLEKGLKYGNDNALLHVKLAEGYHVLGRDADARKQCEFILAMKPQRDYEAERKEAVAGAQKLLEEIK